MIYDVKAFAFRLTQASGRRRREYPQQFEPSSGAGSSGRISQGVLDGFERQMEPKGGDEVELLALGLSHYAVGQGGPGDCGASGLAFHLPKASEAADGVG
ncbi:hypothetical protein AB0C08_04725 [Microbispora bryophytorum]|uniref:hypothetical protein n=1 Tax=Microbispora bryophytorum TaxID=1460882 RepID=UPI0033CBEB82